MNFFDASDPQFLGVFVNDLAIICKSMKRIMELKGELLKIFTTHDLGEIKDLLEAIIITDQENIVMYIKNTSKAKEYAEKFQSLE